MTDADALLRGARLLRFVREEPRNSNWGRAVQWLLEAVGWKKPAPWCAAYVSRVGNEMLEDAWPLPLTASCVAFSEAADKKGILMGHPQRGDVFLLWLNVKRPDGQYEERFAHTGFIQVVASDGQTCLTIEGNTNDGGSRDGWGVFERTRTFGPHDRFIRVIS